MPKSRKRLSQNVSGFGYSSSQPPAATTFLCCHFLFPVRNQIKMKRSLWEIVSEPSYKGGSGRSFLPHNPVWLTLDANFVAHGSNPTPLAQKYAQSVPGTAHAEAYRDAVCLDLNEAVTVVPEDYMLKHFLPNLHPEIDVNAVLDRLVHDEVIQDRRWKQFPQDPCNMTVLDKNKNKKPLHEDKVFKKFEELANAVRDACLAVSNVPNKKSRCVFKCNPSRAPESLSRHSLSRPGSYAILSSATAATDATEKAKWVDIAVPGEFKKSGDDGHERDVSKGELHYEFPSFADVEM